MIQFCAHRFSSCLALALVLGASSGHLFCVSVWDVEQDTGTLLAAVRAKQRGPIINGAQKQSFFLFIKIVFYS